MCCVPQASSFIRSGRRTGLRHIPVGRPSRTAIGLRAAADSKELEPAEQVWKYREDFAQSIFGLVIDSKVSETERRLAAIANSSEEGEDEDEEEEDTTRSAIAGPWPSALVLSTLALPCHTSSTEAINSRALICDVGFRA